MFGLRSYSLSIYSASLRNFIPENLFHFRNTLGLFVADYIWGNDKNRIELPPPRTCGLCFILHSIQQQKQPQNKNLHKIPHTPSTTRLYPSLSLYRPALSHTSGDIHICSLFGSYNRPRPRTAHTHLLTLTMSHHDIFIPSRITGHILSC